MADAKKGTYVIVPNKEVLEKFGFPEGSKPERVWVENGSLHIMGTEPSPASEGAVWPWAKSD